MDNFNILPTEIVSDILARLPAESVLECKSVSKPWRNLIQHPSFYKMHVNRHDNHVDSGNLGFLAAVEDEFLYYFEYTENHEKPIDKIRTINLTPPFKFHLFAGSFNGLICLSVLPSTDNFCICNPMTKEYVILPEPKIDFSRWTGFGYVASTNEYKAVIMHKNHDEFVTVLVYTLGSGNGWRDIGKFDLKFDGFSGYGIFVNGALHWRDYFNDEGMILVFDLADENFREYISPPTLPMYSFLHIGVLSGFLSGVRRYISPDYKDVMCHETWIHMKKKDEHLSSGWSKEVTLYDDNYPLALAKNGGVLAYGSNYLDIYHPKNFTYERLLDFKEQYIIKIFPHNNTLVSLKQLGEEGTKTMKSLNNSNEFSG